MELVIKIDLDNAAFCDIPGQEVARILKGYAEKISNNDDVKSLFERFRDFDGNSVGTAQVFLEPVKEEKSVSASKLETNIVIGLQGGLVQWVGTDSEQDINCLIVDYDGRDEHPDYGFKAVFKDKDIVQEHLKKAGEEE